MKEEFLWPILNVIFIICAFLFFLSGGSMSFLVLGLIFLPVTLIETYRIKKLSFQTLLTSLLGIVIIQFTVIMYIYLNEISYLKNSTDHIAFYGLLIGFIGLIFLFIYLYRQGDLLNKKLNN